MQAEATPIQTDVAQPTAAPWWNAARQFGFAAALWRLPNTTDKHLIIQLDSLLTERPADLEELPAGFVMSPFANFDFGTGVPFCAPFLRADVHVIQTGTGWQVAEKAVLPGTETFLAVAREWTPANQPAAQIIDDPTAEATNTAARHQFEHSVEAAVSAMQRGAFRKVVLSRTKTVAFTDEPDAVALFEQLCVAYPTAFVSAVWLPNRQQVWISATPERLVSVDAAGMFRTVSLAGTQSAYEAGGRLKRTAEALWSQKEIEEQAIVSRYIIECFKKIRLREYLEEGPKTILAGNLMHLGSQFTVDTQAVRYPQLGTVMIRLLHPTSAVCGMPRADAFTFINQHEGYDREFYSGFLGPVNMAPTQAGSSPESHLFVHIRCMKIEANIATLYAGAGLTEDSDPQKEWQETEMKSQTLLAVMRSL
ncbi:MAG: chorismate-binding protein [Rudanella sp.]|nr:chorismate-binding protein [Rudanella sp.]